MKARFLALTAATLIALPTLAAPTHEISGNADVHYKLNKDEPKWNYGAKLGYDYSLSNELQIGGAFSLNKDKAGSLDAALSVGPTYNIGEFSEAFFVGAHLIYKHHNDLDANGAQIDVHSWGFDVQAGKRLEIASGVSWKPYVAYTMFFKPSPSTWVFDIVPVSLSVHW